MATILDRYGIKEVADCTFYEIDESGNPTVPVLYLDTLKVSTIEQTAESTSARGGKGNPELIVWDYGKEITVNIEDALFSAKSMAIMFGDVNKKGDAAVAIESSGTILRTFRKEEIDTSVTGKALVKIHNQYYDLKSTSFVSGDVSYYDEAGSSASSEAVASGSYAYAVATIKTKGTTKIEINPDTFPGTYYITGDTYARSETTGNDEFFQFVIRKAKVTSEVTLTMEAEGDPSTFSMNLRVLRPKSGAMMELIKYDYAVDGLDVKPTE